MFKFEESVAHLPKAELYAQLVGEARGLMAGEADSIANAANLSALIYQRLPDLNWAGFYRLQGEVLVLGPFQGKPACIRIPLGRGVCGTAAAERVSQIVPDVHDFPGHIACDAASRSELVVPILQGEEILGVLDLDSPTPDRFDAEDRAGCEALVRVYVESLSQPL